MSSQANVDPDEIDKFIRELERFNKDIAQSTSRMKSRFNTLGETWKDQEYRKYAETFKQTMITIDRFMRESKECIPPLKKKAQIIRQYLNQTK